MQFRRDYLFQSIIHNSPKLRVKQARLTSACPRLAFFYDYAAFGVTSLDFFLGLCGFRRVSADKMPVSFDGLAPHKAHQERHHLNIHNIHMGWIKTKTISRYCPFNIHNNVFSCLKKQI
jgi:hypothetical protein